MEDFVDPMASDPLAMQQRAAEMLAQMRTARPVSWRANPKAAPYVTLISQIAERTGVPADALGSMIERESQFDPNAVSPAGAVGIAQLMPIHHRLVNPRDPKASIAYAANYLSHQHKRFGDWGKAFGAYNYGPGNVVRAMGRHGDKWLTAVPEETQNYVNALAPYGTN